MNASPSVFDARIAHVALPLQSRAAPIDVVNAEKRSVELVFTTGATVRRRRWVGWDTVVPFDEILEVSKAAVNLDRLNSGGPVLDSHDTWSTDSIRAVVENAWIDEKKKEGRAMARFPEVGVDAPADRMFALIQQRIIRNVSVGYTLDKVRIEEAEKKGEVEKHYVERWTPHEISFVTIPADAGAGVRSHGEDALRRYPCEIERLVTIPTNGNAAPLARMRMRMRRLGLR